MSSSTSSMKLSPRGSELSESSWDAVFKVIFNQNPLITINDGVQVVKSRILAHKSKDKSHTRFVIAEFDKELVRRLLEKKRKLLTTAHYFKNGYHYKITTNARIESYTIFMGYPALILNIIPPVRQISSLLVAVPTEKRPVYVDIPVDGGSKKLPVKELSSEFIKIEERDLDRSKIKIDTIEGMRVQFYDLAEVYLNGRLTKSDKDLIRLDLVLGDENVSQIIDDYLLEEFREKVETPSDFFLREEKIEEKKESSSEGKILIVDDRPDSVAPVKSLLEDYGYEVITAETGLKGLQLTFTMKPDLILLDVSMPGFSGMQVLERLREYKTTSSIPVIMLTGLSDLDLVLDAKEKGISGYLKKPCDLKELLNKVKEILNNKVN